MNKHRLLLAAVGVALVVSGSAAFAQHSEQMKFRHDGFENGWLTTAPQSGAQVTQQPAGDNSNYPGFGPNTGSVTGSGVVQGPQAPVEYGGPATSKANAGGR